MFRFQPRAPFDLTVYDGDNVGPQGPPLSQGFILSLISLVASEHCKPETLEMLDQLETYSWYHGQNLETILTEMEELNPTLVIDIGKNIYYSLRSQFVAMNIHTPEDVILTLPEVWKVVTRGDSGWWKSHIPRPYFAIVEAQQPYNCLYEQGALQGSIEAFEAQDVHVEHVTCMRRGDSCCTFEISWKPLSIL
jgi:hypothetical protein